MTDTEIKNLWESAASRLSGDELDREYFVLRSHWREILERKRRGELTDDTTVTAAEAIITDTMRWALIPIEITRDTVHFEEDPARDYASIAVQYAGMPSDFVEPRWDKFADKIDLEIGAAGLTEYPMRYATATDVGTGQQFKTAIWKIGTCVWEGPPRARGQR